MAKRRYITFKVEDVTSAAGLRSQGPAGEPLGVRCGRCMRFCGFCCVCTCTLFQALAPWMLCLIEAGTLVLLLLLVVVPRRPPGPYSFDFHVSLEDVALLGCLRASALASTYACGSSSMNLRPYLYASYVCGCGGVLYVTFKACVYSYPVAWLPPAAIMVTFATFSWLHILAARYTLTWYRRRGQLGLLQGPRQSQGNSRLLLGDASECVSGGGGGALLSGGADVPAELLADCDSHFLDVDGLVVHYKEASPAAAMCGAPQASPGSSEVDPRPGLVRPDVALMCVHGFGGGVFAWRHLMQPLADAVGVRVVAFDRPGFGLTARPEAPLEGASVRAQEQHRSSTSLTQPLLPTHTRSTQAHQQQQQQQHQQQQQQNAANPYTSEAQARLMLRLCELLGIHQVLFVAHADGCVVAAQAAAAAGGGAAGMLQQRELWHPSCTHNQQQQQAAGLPCQVCNSSSGNGSTDVAESGHGSISTSPNPVSMLVVPSSTTTLHKSGPCVGSDGGVCASLGQSRNGGAGVAVGQEGTLSTLQPQQQQQQPQRLADDGAVLTPPSQEPPWRSNSSSTCSKVTCTQAGGSSSSSQQHQSFGSRCTPNSGGDVGGTSGCVLHVCGLALLHPVLSGQHVPALTRLLAATSLGRSIIRPLLRSEVGVVTQRRAWAHPEALTSDVLALYERPLRVEGWDAALLATCREAAATKPQQLAAHFAAIKQQPVLCVTGEFDRIATASKVSAVAAMLSNVSHGVVPDCGHLSHEEAPQRLLALLAPFCTTTLHNTAAAAVAAAAASPAPAPAYPAKVAQ